MPGINSLQNSVLLLDLDDTLFPEIDYFQSALDLLLAEKKKQSISLHDVMPNFNLIRREKQDIISEILSSIEMPQEENHLDFFNKLLFMRTSIKPYPEVNEIIAKILESGFIKISVLTNGIPQMQLNKWSSIAIDSKDSISFNPARSIFQDKPDPHTFEVWRQMHQVDWSQVICIGDRLENDIAFPSSQGAKCILIGSQAKNHTGFIETTNAKSALSLVLQGW